MAANGSLNFFMEKTDFPREQVYDSLSEIITQRSFVITPVILKSLMSQITSELVTIPKIEKAFGCLLVHLNQIEKVVRWSVTEHLPVVTKREIFRENTLASCIIQNTFKYIGRDYLKATFKDLITQLLSSSDNLEIDPIISGGEIDDVKKNMVALTNWTGKFMDKLASSFDELPDVIKNICSILNEEVIKRFKEDEEKDKIATDVISNFLILRYVALAIISPAEYGLVKSGSIKNDKQKRNLVLIAKVLQASAYGNPFRNHFDVMNTVVENNNAKYVSFMQKLREVELPKDCNCEVPKIDQYNQEVVEAASLVIKYLQTSISSDVIVKESLGVFYHHVIEQTGVYTGEEMMEMLNLFTRLQWIVRTEWFTDSPTLATKSLPLPKSVSKMLKFMSANKQLPKAIAREGSKDMAALTNYTSVDDWFKSMVKRQKYTIIVFYRGFFCTGCKQNLAEWSKLSTIIRETGGEIFGITSESPAATAMTQQKWNLNFDLVSDPSTTLAECYNIHVEEAAALGWNMLGDYGKKFSQPAVMCISNEGELLYYWKQNPTVANLFGGTGRPAPIEALTSILDNFVDDDQLFGYSVGVFNDAESQSSLATGNGTTSVSTKTNLTDSAELVGLFKTMDRVGLHRFVSNAVQHDELAVDLYSEIKMQKKNIRDAKKRVKKLQKKNSRSSVALNHSKSAGNLTTSTSSN